MRLPRGLDASSTPAGDPLDAVVARVHRSLLSGSRYRPHDIATAVAAEAPELDASRRSEVAARVTARLAGLGDLRQLLDEPGVTDILINGPGDITIERDGVLEAAGVVSGSELERVIEFLLGPTGRRVDRRAPMVDVRLDARTRCHVVVPPVAVGGPFVSLRRFTDAPWPLEAFGDDEMAARLRDLVDRRANVLVHGPTGSGKTSLLASLLSAVPHTERIVILEESAELVVEHPHVVQLEAQPANLDGVGGVTLEQLVVTSLRMRPDRVVVGEVRGPEAAGLVQALSTGHLGSMGTLHASDADEAIWRLAELARAGGLTGDVSSRVMRSVDVLICVDRMSDGRRRVSDIVETRGGSCA